MAASSDENVPGPPRGARKPAAEDEGGETTATARAPAVPEELVAAALGTEDDRALRRSVDAKLVRGDRDRALGAQPAARPSVLAASKAGGAAVGAPASARPRPALPMTSKKATVQGLGVPVPTAPRQTPGAGRVPPAPATTPSAASEAEELDDSVTATAPAPNRGAGVKLLPTAKLGPVTITDLSEDEGDETEVRTVVAGLPTLEAARPAPRPAAGRPSQPDHDEEGADAIDDSVTALAPAPHVALPADGEGRTPPPVLAPAPLPAPTRPAAARPTAPSVDMYESDDSITAKGPAVSLEDDDVVTAERPAEGRASRAPSSPGLVRLTAPEDDLPENHTAVMMNAPVTPASRPVRSRPGPPRSSGPSPIVPADRTSDSGLRIAPALDAKVEHASLGVLLAGTPGGRFPEPEAERAPNPYAATAPLFAPLEPGPIASPLDPALQATVPAGDLAPLGKPAYGLLVGVAACASVLIPVILYLALRGAAAANEPLRVPASVEPDHVGAADPPRGKAPRGPVATPTPAPAPPPRAPWWKRR